MHTRILSAVTILVVVIASIGGAQTADSGKDDVATPDTVTTEQPAEVSSGLTVEAELCTGVEERMPVGAADMFSNDVGQLFLWSKVTGAADTTFVKHHWVYKGEEIAVVELAVRSASWRTWSAKSILPEWIGDWEVRITDASGRVLKTLSFTINEAPAQ